MKQQKLIQKEEQKLSSWKNFIDSLAIFALSILSFLILSMFLGKANATVAEMFAPSAKTLGTAGQATGSYDDPENNYYFPSMIGFSKGNQYSFSTFYIQTDFNRIDNVVVKNQLTNNVVTYGNVDTNYEPAKIGTFHANLPLFKKRLNTRLGVSLYFPVDQLMETSSGDFYLPEYVMYKSRYRRTTYAINVVQPFYLSNGKPDWAASFGLNGGMETTGETYIVAFGFGDTEPSSGKLKFEAKPLISPVASYTKHFYDSWWAGIFSASYQHKIENKLSTDASGYTPIATNSSIPFDMTLKSTLYYDPSILRLNYVKDFNPIKLMFSLEWQDWSDYQTPKLNIVSRTGFNTSKNFEKLNTQDIFIPRIAATIPWNDNHQAHIGAFYKPTPIKNSFNGAGNSVDADITGLAVGTTHNFLILDEPFQFNIAYQHHIMNSQGVNKTTGLEDGTAGTKVGSPGYSVGGTVQIVSFGINWKI